MTTPAQRQAFLNLCSQANTLVDLAERRFSAWLSSLAIPYGKGWTNHTAALKEAETEARLASDLILNAALAFIPGGVGGIVGETFKRLDAGAFVVDSIKDLGKWGMRSGAIIGATPNVVTFGVSPAGLKAFPADPLQWQNEINSRVQTELADATRHIERWQNAVNTGERNFDPSFNPVEKVTLALAIRTANGTVAQLVMLTPLTQEEQDRHRRQFEQGWMTEWVRTQAFATYVTLSQFAWGRTVDRLEAYGKRIGLPNLRKEVGDTVNRGVSDRNRRVVARRHGLI